MAAAGVTIRYQHGAAFGAQVRLEHERYARVIRESRIRVD